MARLLEIGKNLCTDSQSQQAVADEFWNCLRDYL